MLAFVSFSLAASAFRSVLSTGVASPAADLLSLASFAVAVTFSPALILSFGSVTAPVVLSIVIDGSVPSGSFHSPFSFVATSVCGCPALSVYLISTLFVSASVGGVIAIEPSSFAFTLGAPGAALSLEFIVASSDDFPFSSIAFAFIAELFFTLLAGIVISPVFSSIVIAASVPSGSFHLPFVFVAFNAVSVSLPAGIYLTSSTLALSSAGFTVTLPSFAAFNTGALSFSSTVSACASCPILPSFSTVTDPSFATLISLAVNPAWSLAANTAATTLAFSSAVNDFLLSTGVLAGATSLIVLSLSCTSSTVWAGWINAVFVPISTETVPLGSTLISSSVSPRSGLAAFIASLTFCFSASVSLLVSPTFTLSAGGFNVFPSLVNGLTVSSAFKVPVFFPSAVVTVTLPLLSTSTLSPSARLFFCLTAAATFSLSSCVKLARFFTSTFSSGAWSSSIVSFCTTVLSAVIVPTLPPWLISTVPSGFTVISSSLKFLSGLASFTACLIAAISSSFKSPILSTLTGSFGGLKLFWTSFCLTVLSGVNVPVLPSFVTVTVPSSATVTSASVMPLSLFASTTAFLTLSISSDVNDLVSFTSTGVGSFNSNEVFSVFSQTAYTVFGALTLFKMLASASLASFVAAQPLKVYPSLVGSIGFLTLLLSALTVVVSLPSPNLPSFASKVTATSSE